MNGILIMRRRAERQPIMSSAEFNRVIPLGFVIGKENLALL
jgi:hypothetical protein